MSQHEVELAELVAQARRRFDGQDYSGALDFAARALAIDAANAEAAELADRSEAHLVDMYVSSFGGETAVLSLLKPMTELQWIVREPSAKKVCQAIDGKTMLGEILKKLDLPRITVMRKLRAFEKEGLVTVAELSRPRISGWPSRPPPSDIGGHDDRDED